MSMITSYVRTHIIHIADMCTMKVNECAVTSKRSVLVKKSRIVMLGPHYVDYVGIRIFVAQE